MGEFAIGQSVSRFEDPRLLKGGGRYVGDMVLPGMVFGYVLRSPHAHARIRSIDVSRAKAAPGVLAVLTGADWQASGWGDLPVPGGLEAPRRQRVPPALSGAGQGPRALCRRLCRLRRRGDLPSGARCGRADRGRLRAAAGLRVDRRGDQGRRAAGLGRLPRQYRLRAALRRQGRDRGGVRERRPCRQASLCHQSRDRGQHGAARLPRRLQRHAKTATPSTRRCSARIRFARSWRPSSRCRRARSAWSPATSAAASA